jgi:hypothetical protein
MDIEETSFANDGPLTASKITHAAVARLFIFGFHVSFLLLYFLAVPAGNSFPNMGSPLFDCCSVASS